MDKRRRRQGLILQPRNAIAEPAVNNHWLAPPAILGVYLHQIWMQWFGSDVIAALALALALALAISRPSRR